MVAFPSTHLDTRLERLRRTQRIFEHQNRRYKVDHIKNFHSNHIIFWVGNVSYRSFSAEVKLTVSLSSSISSTSWELFEHYIVFNQLGLHLFWEDLRWGELEGHPLLCVHLIIVVSIILNQHQNHWWFHLFCGGHIEQKIPDAARPWIQKQLRWLTMFSQLLCWSKCEKPLRIFMGDQNM